MPEIHLGDFDYSLSTPTLAYEEGLRFFRGVGRMNDTLRQLAEDLRARGISYSIIGAVALNQHGYRRFTEDIDVLMTKDGLAKFSKELVGRGYHPAFAGATKKFRATAANVPIEIITTGEYPGDGRPKPIIFPDPADYSVEIDGISTITLEKLVELKLASGISGLGRRKDLADVQELIRVRSLDEFFGQRLDESVHPMYEELRQELILAAKQELAPNRE